MKYTTFIFDMDGTLIDTVDDLTNAVNYALSKYDYEQKTRKVIKNYLGDGIDKLIERCIPMGLENKNFYGVRNLFKEHYSENIISCTKAYKDIVNVLKKLKENNCKIAIVSNKSDVFLDKLVRHFFNSYVDVSVGESKNLQKNLIVIWLTMLCQNFVPQKKKVYT